MGVFVIVVFTVLWLRFRGPARAWWRQMTQESQAESSRRARAGRWTGVSRHPQPPKRGEGT